MIRKFPNALVIFIILSTFTCQLFGQRNDSLPAAVQDSPAVSFVQKLQKAGQQESAKSIKAINANRADRQQRFLLNEIRKNALETKLYLQRGIDTNEIAQRLEQTRQDMNTAREGTLPISNAGYTLRDLKVTTVILNSLAERTEQDRKRLDEYINRLTRYRERIDSLTGDTALMEFSDDSVTLTKYLRRLAITAQEINPTDNALRQTLINVQDLQTKVDLVHYELNANLEQVENLREMLAGQTMSREFPLTGPQRSLAEVFHFSWKKDQMALTHYFESQGIMMLVLAVLIMLSWSFIRTLKVKSQREHPASVEQPLVIRYPVSSAMIIVICLFQFLFPDPPFLLNLLLWFIPALLLIFVFRGHISPVWMRFWIGIVAFFMLASAVNLLLRASDTERWLIGGLALTGTVYGSWHLVLAQKSKLREKKITYFILFLVVMEAAAFVFGLTGRYNLAKIFMTCGYFGILIAILFLWTLRLINEGLAIASNIYQQPDRKLFFINFERVGGSAPSAFYVALVFGWFVLVARNFYIYTKLAGQVNAFVNDTRTLGSYSFSIKGILIFFTILACSMFLSRLISFFASEDHQPARGASKFNLGSWLLLVRITVISTGLFLAVAAAGIPLDRITIIIGALGVGIGLGLQGLVSNLVSGLILAFEKPITVGDLIEVNGKTGTMKAIGFRSSTITLSNGSVNVIPNSVILNEQLVNWSTGKKQARGSVSIGVAYGTDLEKVKQVIKSTVANQNAILPHPAPQIFASGFADSAVNFDVSFWVSSMPQLSEVKSALLIAIYNAFQAGGIDIPFPQRDLHIIPPTPKKDV